MNPRNFFVELKRRNVIRMAGLYLVGAWLLTQVASTVLPAFDVPGWALGALIITLALGFVPALVFSWIFELTPDGLKRDAEVVPERSIAPQTARRMDRMIIAVLVLALAYFGFDKFVLAPRREAISKNTTEPAPAAPAVANPRSIAVLPFENLSSDKDNAYFADGIQDEILTHLAKVAALKVISRTSTQKYKSAPDNLREIGRQLGVANLLEGSVQKVANSVHVNVQLIRVATDEHLWAESYNRKLDDIFGVEGEVAKAIAEALQAKLTGGEQQALAVKPTENAEAYDSYLRGLALDGRTSAPDDVLKVVGFYERAVQLDPGFAVAWAKLSRANAEMFFFGFDSSAVRRQATERALSTAQKLQPDSAETLLAQAYYQYRLQRDYELAKATFGRVRELLPGSSEVPGALAAIARRQGHWEESVACWEQTLALDPRNTQWLTNAAGTYAMLRRFPAALKIYDRVLDLLPNDPDTLAAQAGIYQAEGQLEQAGKLLAGVTAQSRSFGAVAAKVNQLELERRCDEAVQFLKTRLAESPNLSGLEMLFDQGQLIGALVCAGDTAGARATATQMLPPLEAIRQQDPDNVLLLQGLSLIHAVLGDKAAALKAAERAMALRPSATDAVDGPGLEENLAFVETWIGDKDRAIPLLQHLLETPYTSFLTPAHLRLNPQWDSLRDDPRFQKLIATDDGSKKKS